LTSPWGGDGSVFVKKKGIIDAIWKRQYCFLKTNACDSQCYAFNPHGGKVCQESSIEFKNILSVSDKELSQDDFEKIAEDCA
jgi:hypothetical protein